MIGVRADGRKELVALTDGYRESTESWADLLRDCERRGMRAPVLAIGRRRAGVLGRAAGGVPGDQGAALLVPQDGERACRAAEVGASRRRRGRCRRSSTPRTASTPASRRRRSRSTTAPSFPRPSRRSPTTWTCCWRSTTTRPSTGSICGRRIRSNRRSRPSGTAPRSPRARLPGGRPGDGVQAHRGRPGPLAGGERAPPGRPRPRRRDLPQRQARRTTRRHTVNPKPPKDLDPQVLTISRVTCTNVIRSSAE